MVSVSFVKTFPGSKGASLRDMLQTSTLQQALITGDGQCASAFLTDKKRIQLLALRLAVTKLAHYMSLFRCKNLATLVRNPVQLDPKQHFDLTFLCRCGVE